MAELADRRTPFVKATVVRVSRPASARPGDVALVLEDGHVEGFVGGACAESTVRAQALGVLRRGEPLLVRISPDVPQGSADVREGALTVANPCLSGGELEIFLEPLSPIPRMLVFGDTPIGRAVAALGRTLEYDVQQADPGGAADEELGEAAAVIVATHGHDEEPVLTRAVRAGVPYIGLVSSPKRGAAVLASLDLAPEESALIHNPAGLWIGARTPGEIAVSILAEFIETVFTEAAREANQPMATESVVGTVVDPVCGMAVAVSAETPHVGDGAEQRWFCSTGCRDVFAADPGHYPEVAE
jgi:xanthine dehydrogenase accessory factor